MTALIEQVAAFAARARETGLPETLRGDAARRVLDVMGNCLAAATEEPARIVTETVDGWGGHEVAHVIGRTRRYPAPSAALVDGTLAHALDFDDTHLPSVLHPSSSVVPAALAAAEAEGRTGTALLDAVAVGDEVCVRLGVAGYDEALGNSIFFERGQHATAICGTVGAAVAVGMLYELDPAGIAAAAGIAASMGAGLLEANRTGGTVKRVHCGWAAHAAVAAGDLARRGLTGPPTVLEGRFGFFQAWCGDNARPDLVVRDLGDRWETPGIFFKPYPCNHFTHAGIDAALRLKANGLAVDDVDSIELGAPAAVLRTIAQPPEIKAAPPSGYAAAFSGPYTVAAALTGGGGLGVWLDDFTDEAARDPHRLDLASKVTCVPDAHCDEIFPRQFPAVLRIRTRTGQTHEVRVDANRGGPDNPLSDAELAAKFALGARRALPNERVARLEEAVLGLADAPSVADVLALAARLEEEP
ncbi:MAG: MmgE/PrpD family protein [Streptosporangiaceae bacterium]